MISVRLAMVLILFAFSDHIKAQKNEAVSNPKVEVWKNKIIKSLDEKQKSAREMVDMVFSFSELGFQETETSAYLTGIMKKMVSDPNDIFSSENTNPRYLLAYWLRTVASN